MAEMDRWVDGCAPPRDLSSSTALLVGTPFGRTPTAEVFVDEIDN